MVQRRPTGRTPHETVEIPPEVLDCGHRYGPGRVTIGVGVHPDGTRRRTWTCRECGTVTYDEDPLLPARPAG